MQLETTKLATQMIPQINYNQLYYLTKPFKHSCSKLPNQTTMQLPKLQKNKNKIWNKILTSRKKCQF